MIIFKLSRMINETKLYMKNNNNDEKLLTENIEQEKMRENNYQIIKIQ